MYFVTFPYGVLGQVWYFIVWILDRCPFSYFVVFARGICIYIYPGEFVMTAHLMGWPIIDWTHSSPVYAVMCKCSYLNKCCVLLMHVY